MLVIPLSFSYWNRCKYFVIAFIFIIWEF